MKLFLDSTFAPPIYRAFAELLAHDNHAVAHMTTLFPDGDPGDENWIPSLPAKGWPIFVTGDARIVRNPQRQKAILDADLIGVFLAGYAHYAFWDQVAKLTKWWPSIERLLRHTKPGKGIWVSGQGKVEPARALNKP